MRQLPRLELPVVVNKYKESYDVYIGRGSKWGNPYVIGKDGDREEVISKYRLHIEELIEDGSVSRADLLSLTGKRLGCFCKPKPCHGDIIVELIRGLLNENQVVG